MAFSITPLGIGGNALRLVIETISNATSNNNVNDGAATIYAVVIDNTGNGGKEFTKFYNVAVPTVGTTDPDMILMSVGSLLKTFIFKTGNNFSAFLSFATVTAGGTAGVTNPVNSVPVKILLS
jgi:hypothetical protein